MKIQSLAAAASAVTVAAQTAVDLGNKTPFLPNRKVRARIDLSADAAGAPVIKIQGSDDNSTWNDLLVNTGLASNEAMVTAYRYMRANVTTGATSTGTYNAFIEA